MFAAALLELAEGLRDAGLNASVDPAEVSPPGIVVRPDALLPGSAKLCGDYPVRTSLLLVVPDTSTIAALQALEDLYVQVGPAVRDAGSTLAPDEATFQRLVMPDDPTGLPALRLTALTIAPAPTGRNTP